MADSIKIMVRVRPFNPRQIQGNFKNVVQMEGQELRLTNPDATSDPPRKFGFHRCYYSTDDSMGHPPVSNKEVFQDIGMQILDQIYQGYNATIFAYGQTGSGKSFSIEGKEPEKGLLQMCLQDIFCRKKEQNGKNGLATSVRVTYLQIYNEKLRDLVNPHQEGQKEPKVVQIGNSITISGVDAFPVNSYEDVLKVFEDGKKVRVVGSTKMNNTSSRSHAIFTIHYKETGKGKMIDAKFNIVDLAGSERQTKTGATGKRLEEANNINKSLTNLGIVIEKLAHNCVNKKNDFIPYRNSLLTHILSESLAGNSKTFMIAAISPADDNYEESLSTLRFAQRASLISTKTQKNVTAKEGYNKQLLIQIERLKKELEQAKNKPGTTTVIKDEKEAQQLNKRISTMMGEVQQNKADKEALMKELEEERRMKEQIQKNRKKLLDEAGLSKTQNINERKTPYIMNVSEDPTLLGMLLYDLKEGQTNIGTKDADENHVKLNVLGIMTRHCAINNEGGQISIEPLPQAKVFVNGALVTKKTNLNHLDRITLGHANNFKLIIPGKSSPNDLRESMLSGGQFGEYIDDKISANTIEAKSMKQFLVDLQQRLDKHNFAKYLEKFRTTFNDVDEMNQYTFQRYRKFPLKSKNVHFRLKTVIDIENYMKGVPELLIVCEHKETKEPLFAWTQEKFQDRLADMQDWYVGSNQVNSSIDSHDFDPWFQPDDHYVKEKAKLQHMKPRQAVEVWQKKQAQNAQNYKKVQQEINATLKDLHSLGYSQNIVEDYADFYFRNFPVDEKLKSNLQNMRKNEHIHQSIHRYMECYAELKECEINNQYYNEQRSKYMRGNNTVPPVQQAAKKPEEEPTAVKSSPAGNDAALQKQIEQLRSRIQQLQTDLKSHDGKTEELQEEIKRQAKIINKEIKRK